MNSYLKEICGYIQGGVNDPLCVSDGEALSEMLADIHSLRTLAPDHPVTPWGTTARQAVVSHIKDYCLLRDKQ